MADKKEIKSASDTAAGAEDLKNTVAVSGKGEIVKAETVKNNRDTDYSVGEYKFAARSDYERALKEQETINYIIGNTNFSDIKAVLKIYNRAVENKSFKTAIGINFMKDLRDKIVNSGILEEKMIAPIPVQKLEGSSSGRMGRDEKDAQIKRYREAYENADAGMKVRNIIIAFLVVIIVAMIIVTYMSRYSVFTYFTDYKADMENELIDQYEHWQQQLEKRESAVKEKEDKLGIEYDSSIDESISDDSDNVSGKSDAKSDGENDKSSNDSGDAGNSTSDGADDGTLNDGSDTDR